MIYRERAPSPALRSIVERLWCLEGPADAIAAEPIPPDGHPEIIVHVGQPFAEHTGDRSWHVQDRVLLAGQTSRAVLVAPRGETLTVGARLRPDGAHLLFGIAQHALTNQIVDLRDVHRPLARRLHDDVAARPDAMDPLHALDHALRAIVSSSPVTTRAAHASPLRHAIAIADARGGLLRVDDLAREMAIGARQLERVFQDRIGLSPKLFLRIVRFQQVLGAIRSGSDARTWADLAMAHGFYDQAHFIRDCRLFANGSPRALNVSDESLTAVFSAIRRAKRDVGFFQDARVTST